MACHPSGIAVNIVGLEVSNHGRSCEKHKVCGSVVKEDSIVRLKVVQLAWDVVNKVNPEVEATAIAVYLVTGEIDICKVVFLRRFLLKYQDEYDARLAQVTEVYSANSDSSSNRAKYHRNKGCAQAVLIEAEYRESTSPPSKKHKADNKSTK